MWLTAESEEDVSEVSSVASSPEVSSVASSSVSSVASSVLVSVLVLVLEPEFLDLDLPLFAHSTDKTNSIVKRKIGLMLKDNHALRVIKIICFHFSISVHIYTKWPVCCHVNTWQLGSSHIYIVWYILLDTHEWIITVSLRDRRRLVIPIYRAAIIHIICISFLAFNLINKL